MAESTKTIADNSSNVHFKLLCQLIYKSLTRPENNLLTPRLCGGLSASAIKDAIEHTASELLTFFSDADSYKQDWLFSSGWDEDADVAKMFGGATNSNRAAFAALYDAVEREATEKAERGDWRDLEKLLLTCGYLRTSEARTLVIKKLRGEKIRRRPSTDYSRLFDEILKIMCSELCSETEARRVWLKRNDPKGREALSENTVKTNFDRAKGDRGAQLKLAISEAFIDSQREKLGMKKIPSRYKRGFERLESLAEKDGWLQK